MNKIIFIIMFVCMAGCSLAPNYTRPEMPVPDSFPEGAAYQNDAAGKMLTLEEFIKDSRLLAIVKMAIDNNRSLRAQIQSVEAARAAYMITRSDQLPDINGKGSAGIGQSGGTKTENYGLAVGLTSYEIDLFGKVRSLKDAALENYLSSAMAAESARISLIAETVNAWLTLAADIEMLKLAENTAKSAAESMTITKGRYDVGVISILNVYQAETTYQQALAAASRYTTIVAQDKNAIQLLAGTEVADDLLPDGFRGSEDWLGQVLPGIKSEVLLRRPDVAAAEHTLLAANANIGAARAAFFPSISLTASAGFASNELSNLFSNDVWSFGGAINLPIFTGGRNRANLNRAKAMYESYLAQYESVIQTAFREVADALARRGTISDQLQAQARLAELSNESYILSQARYKAGVDNYLDVLTNQRTYYSSEHALISIRLAELTNRTMLFRVLGGNNTESEAKAK